MRLFPCIEIKEFRNCEHGDFITTEISGNISSGLCINDEDDKRRFLILSSADAVNTYKVVNHSKTDTVMSYGKDWILTVSGAPMSSPNALRSAGNLVHTSEGPFLIGMTMQNGGYEEPMFCKLDGPGAWLNIFDASPRFAFQDWKIQILDQTLTQSYELATRVTRRQKK
jgi:hypothetical protein